MSMVDSMGNKKIKLYAMITLASTVVAVILRTCCLLWFYDEDIGYYSKGILPIVLSIFSVLALGFFASAIFTVKPTDKLSDGREDNLAIKISSAICALVFASFFIVSVMSTSLISDSVVADLLSKISALMMIVYFAMNLFGKNVNRNAQTVLGFGFVLWAICALAISYFDVYVQLNSPDKVTLHMGLMSAMAFFTVEFRCFVDKINRKVYPFCSACSVFFCALASIPSLFKWVIDGMGEYKYLFYYVVLFALLIYSAARFFSFAFANNLGEVNIEPENMAEGTDNES